MDHATLIIFISSLITIATAWGVGSADLANILSTSIGSKAIKVKTAIFIAIIFEFSGAFFGGGHVSKTLQNDIINLALIHQQQMIIYAMLAISLASASWMIIASAFGLPASITNSIVGALVGFGWSVFGTSAINWPKIAHIAASWIISPTVCAFISYLLFVTIQRLILIRPHPERYVKKYFYPSCFIVGLILAHMMVFKILTTLDCQRCLAHKCVILFSTGLLCMAIGFLLNCTQKKITTPLDRPLAFAYVEKKFSILMAFTACAMVFAHGSNDIPISVTPFSIIAKIIYRTSGTHFIHQLNMYSLTLGGISVILGLLMYGRKVIQTVGSGITTLTPSRAFSATIATACVVIFSTGAGIPISVTQTLVGGVLGVGLARGIGALNLTVVRNIFLSWFVTIPATSLLAIFYFSFIKEIFH
jgi:inorganic phosphate transporter, PiT family